MTAPPPLNLDPITGLPSDFLAPDLYQIPLNSRPQLAPEWSPDHLPPNALHPDNMPSMFATIQAQNQLNPGLPQACTTDGAGNLNVNMKAGGGGGGGGAASAQYANNDGGGQWGSAGTFTNANYGIFLDPTVSSLVSAHVQFVVTAVASGENITQIVAGLEDVSQTVYVPLFHYFVGDNGTVYGDGRYIFERVFSPPMDINATFGAGAVPHLHVNSSYCTWAGAYRFTGLA